MLRVSHLLYKPGPMLAPVMKVNCGACTFSSVLLISENAFHLPVLIIKKKNATKQLRHQVNCELTLEQSERYKCDSFVFSMPCKTIRVKIYLQKKS